MQKVIGVASLLIDIEVQLRQLNQWQVGRPSAAALNSHEPFCIDTLSFPQWLQFVFLVRMHKLLEQQQPLPDSCSIAPMASEYFNKTGLGAVTLIATVEKLDRLLSA